MPTAVSSPVSAWVETLELLGVSLEGLTQDTEAIFEEAGRDVGQFTETVNGLAAELNTFVALISGDLGQRAGEALESGLRLSNEMTESARANNEVLEQIRHEAQRVKQTLTGLSNIVATFHSLGLLTRIETARLGAAGADFGTLAEDVRLLAKNVQIKIEGALETASEFIAQIEIRLRQLATLHEEQLSDLPKVVSGVMQNLSLFREAQSRAVAVSSRQSAEYREVSDAFVKLIISIQFTDITRQQVEHVVTAIRRLSAPVAPGSVIPLEHAQSATVLELQSAQLDKGADTFRSSVESVFESLNSIADHVGSMVEEARGVQGDDQSGLPEIERGCAAILKSLRSYASLDQMASATASELSEKGGRMRNAVEEIRKIEAQMERIAMNARISVMHLGSSGEALSALSNAIKQRAFESRQTSDALMEGLNLLIDIAHRWTSRLEAGSEKQEFRNSCVVSIGNAIDELRESNEESSKQMGSIFTRGDNLRRDIAVIPEQLKTRLRFENVMADAHRCLSEVCEEIRHAAPLQDPTPFPLDMAEFTSSYTMSSEREVHSNALGGNSQAAAEPAVEFF